MQQSNTGTANLSFIAFAVACLLTLGVVGCDQVGKGKKEAAKPTEPTEPEIHRVHAKMVMNLLSPHQIQITVRNDGASGDVRFEYKLHNPKPGGRTEWHYKTHFKAGEERTIIFDLPDVRSEGGSYQYHIYANGQII